MESIVHYGVLYNDWVNGIPDQKMYFSMYGNRMSNNCVSVVMSWNMTLDNYAAAQL